MDIILLIYIIGVVIAIVVNLAVFNFYKPECLTIGGLIIVILSCIASWFFYFDCYNNVLERNI